MRTPLPSRALRALPLLFLVQVAAAQPRMATPEDAISALSPVRSLVAQAGTGSTVYGLEGVLRQDWTEAGWMPSSQTTNTYSQGRLVARTDHYWGGLSWIPMSRTTFRLDGLVESVEEWNDGTSTFMPLERYEYELTYDFPTGASAPTLIVRQAWNGSAWENADRTSQSVVLHPSAGFLVTGTVESTWIDGAWHERTKTELEENGTSVVQTTWEQAAPGAGWEARERQVFDAPDVATLYGRMETLLAEYGDYEDLALGLLVLPDFETQAWQGADWVPTGRRETTLVDWATGGPAVVVYSEWIEPAGWVETMRHELTYDGTGRIERSSLLVGAGGFGITSIESYTYNETGRVTRAIVELDGGNGPETTTRYLMAWTPLQVSNEPPAELPGAVALAPAWPNPFNPSTSLALELATPGHAVVTVHDALGRRVRTLADGSFAAGTHSLRFDASDLPSGIYVVRAQSGSAAATRTVTLLK